jgi:cytoskeletal protein CcmA (bactofilin family)
MFSKSKINDPIETGADTPKPVAASPVTSTSAAKPNPNSSASASAAVARSKPATGGGPSIISPDLKVIGNLQTEGDLQIEGTVEGDIRANLLTIGENATIRGEVVAEDVVVNGLVVGRIRGHKVRLTSTGRVEGDILHNTIAIEAGAHFEGSVHRADDPINGGAAAKPAQAAKPTAVPGAAPNPAAKIG